MFRCRGIALVLLCLLFPFKRVSFFFWVSPTLCGNHDVMIWCMLSIWGKKGTRIDWNINLPRLLPWRSSCGHVRRKVQLGLPGVNGSKIYGSRTFFKGFYTHGIHSMLTGIDSKWKLLFITISSIVIVSVKSKARNCGITSGWFILPIKKMYCVRYNFWR